MSERPCSIDSECQRPVMGIPCDGVYERTHPLLTAEQICPAALYRLMQTRLNGTQKPEHLVLDWPNAELGLVARSAHEASQYFGAATEMIHKKLSTATGRAYYHTRLLQNYLPFFSTRQEKTPITPQAMQSGYKNILALCDEMESDLNFDSELRKGLQVEFLYLGALLRTKDENYFPFITSLREGEESCLASYNHDFYLYRAGNKVPFEAKYKRRLRKYDPRILVLNFGRICSEALQSNEPDRWLKMLLSSMKSEVDTGVRMPADSPIDLVTTYLKQHLDEHHKKLAELPSCTQL